MTSRLINMVAIALLALLFATGCADDDPIEDAADEVDEAIDEIDNEGPVEEAAETIDGGIAGGTI